MLTSMSYSLYKKVTQTIYSQRMITFAFLKNELDQIRYPLVHFTSGLKGNRIYAVGFQDHSVSEQKALLRTPHLTALFSSVETEAHR